MKIKFSISLQTGESVVDNDKKVLVIADNRRADIEGIENTEGVYILYLEDLKPQSDIETIIEVLDTEKVSYIGIRSHWLVQILKTKFIFEEISVEKIFKLKYEGKKRVLVKSYDGMGDVLMLIPTIKTLAEKGNIVDVQILANKEVLKNLDYIENLYDSSDSLDENDYGRIYDVSYKLSSYEYDYCRQHRMYAEAFLCGLQRSDLVIHKPEIILTEEEIAKGKELTTIYDKKGNPIIKQGYKKIAFCFVSADPRRAYPQDMRKELVKWIDDRVDKITPIVIGGKSELQYPGCIDLRGITTTRELFAVIKEVDCLVAIDTSVIHIAGAFDIPTVMLPSTVPGEWRAYKNTIVCRPNVKCYPCRDRVEHAKGMCIAMREGNYCLRTIKFDLIEKAVRKLIK